MTPRHHDERETLLPLVVTNEDNGNGNQVEVGKNGSTTPPDDYQHYKQYVKYMYSLALLALVVGLIIAGIYAGATPVAEALHPMTAMVFAVFLIVWLGVLEGLQGCLVGLQPIDPQGYSRSHPMALQCTSLGHHGDNLNRFIVGRQFLVVLVVFCLNMCCTPAEDADPVVVPGALATLVPILLSSGLAVMIVTVILGQLAAEVNATHSMLDTINTPVALITTWMCLAIESSGLLHSVYLVQHFFELMVTNNSDQDKTSTTETDTSATTDVPVSSTTSSERIFYWVRVLMSLSILSYSIVATLAALLKDETTMGSDGILSNGVVKVLILLGLIVFLGMMEAMQIALFAVVNFSSDHLDAFPRAKSNCGLAFSGNNFQAFLIGRQICVTMSMFLLARVTTTDVHIENDTDATVLHMSTSLQGFFNTGLPGALITTIVASVAFRIVASCFPIPFLANPFVYPTIRLCLLLEASGVFSAAWVLAKALQKIMGYKNDQEYIEDFGQGCHASSPSKNKNATTSIPFKDLDDDSSANLTYAYSTSSSDDDITSRGSGSFDESTRSYGATLQDY